MQVDTINILVPLRCKWLISVSKDSRHLAWCEDEIGITALTVGLTQMITTMRHMKVTASPPPPSSRLLHCKQHMKVTCRTLWLGLGCFGCFFPSFFSSFFFLLLLLFVYLFFWVEKVNMEGTLRAKELKFLVSACCCFWFLNPGGKILRSGSYF